MVMLGTGKVTESNCIPGKSGYLWAPLKWRAAQKEEKEVFLAKGAGVIH